MDRQAIRAVDVWAYIHRETVIQSAIIQ